MACPSEEVRFIACTSSFEPLLDHIEPRHGTGGHDLANLRELGPCQHADIDPFPLQRSKAITVTLPTTSVAPFLKGTEREDVLLLDVLLVDDGDEVAITFEGALSNWRQGVWLATEDELEVNGVVRATSLKFGTFGLFDCTHSPTCTKIADLRGGYGTTGERVVFSLPLEEIGLRNGGKLKDVVACSALGASATGATKILDTVTVK